MPSVSFHVSLARNFYSNNEKQRKNNRYVNRNVPRLRAHGPLVTKSHRVKIPEFDSRRAVTFQVSVFVQWIILRRRSKSISVPGRKRSSILVDEDFPNDRSARPSELPMEFEIPLSLVLFRSARATTRRFVFNFRRAGPGTTGDRHPRARGLRNEAHFRLSMKYSRWKENAFYPPGSPFFKATRLYRKYNFAFPEMNESVIKK